jgi:hypothetical protein
MERFNNSESSSNTVTNFGDRRTSRQETRRGSRPSASGKMSSRRRNGSSMSPQESSSRRNTDNLTRPSSASSRTARTNNNIEDAAFSSNEKGATRPRRRSIKNSDSNPSKQRSSSKSSYSASSRKSRPRDNSSRFDD